MRGATRWVELACNCARAHALQCMSPKSKIQNPKSKIPRRRLMRDWSRLVELACIASTFQKPECRMQNPKSRIQTPDAGGCRMQNPKSRIPTCPDALRRGGSISSDHPGIRDAPSSDPLLHSCGGLQNFARPRRRILTRAEFCSGLRRIRVGGTRMQIPKSKASSAPAGRGSTQNPESLFHRLCSARESSRISGFWYADFRFLVRR